MMLTMHIRRVCAFAGIALATTLACAAATNTVAAPAASDAPSGFWIVQHLKAGGMTTVVQLILSVFGLGVLLERLVHQRRRLISPPTLAEEAKALWQAGRFDELEARCRRDASVLAAAILTMVRQRHEDRAYIITLAGDAMTRDMRRHLKRCLPLAIVATVEPLLGLFGTVVGMIEAFNMVAIAGSMGNPSILADAISKALITTEVGLAIAIPALVAYNLLRGQVTELGLIVEEDATELMTHWFQRPTLAAP